jgi:hypothetical protein
MTGQPAHCTVLAGLQNRDRTDHICFTGQPAKVGENRQEGQLGQDNQDKAARTAGYGTRTVIWFL